MSWTLLFFFAGLIFLGLYAYHTIRDYQKHQQENSALVPYHHQSPEKVMTNITVPDVFDEQRIKSDLARISSTPGAIGKYIAQAQIRFTQSRQIAVLNRWTEFYQAGKEVIKARTELARAHSELQQVGIEGEIHLKEKDVKLTYLEAEETEARVRKAKADLELQELETELRGGKRRKTEDEREIEVARERITNNARHRHDVTLSPKIADLTALELWKKDERRKVYSNPRLSDEEKDALFDDIDALYSKEKKRLSSRPKRAEEKINIHE
jgi:hypothetical protein